MIATNHIVTGILGFWIAIMALVCVVVWGAVATQAIGGWLAKIFGPHTSVDVTLNQMYADVHTGDVQSRPDEAAFFEYTGTKALHDHAAKGRGKGR